MSGTAFARPDATKRFDDEVEAGLWPKLHSAALPGVVGDIVSAACENSEADPVAVLVSVLAWFAASFGTNPHIMVGDTAHFARIFGIKVGASAKARKGTSEGPPKRIFRKAEDLLPGCRPLVVSKGPLSTGGGPRACRSGSK